AQAELVDEERLAGGRGKEVVAPHNLPHPLRGVVDDHREVVREGAVAPSQHEVVDRLAPLPVPPIGERRLPPPRSPPPRERLPHPSLVEILHPHEEATALRAREEPRE